MEAKWRVGDLPTGVYPLKPRSRTWKVNKHTGIEARRTGFWMLPDFGSTAHMIQGATLDAAFADLQTAWSKVSMMSQIAAYICLSRVRMLERICVLQPFSPFLFRGGSPAGPERLIRKLAEGIESDQALAEWNDERWAEPAESSTDQAKDPLQMNHLCTSCYLKGKPDFILSADKFGMKKPSDFFRLYISQGRWVRCLQCQKDSGVDVSNLAPKPPSADGGARGDAGVVHLGVDAEPGRGTSLCVQCDERTDWKGTLTSNSHGCSACLNVFETTTWSAKILNHHRNSKRQLVCPACADLGYAPGKYESHECEECLNEFGSLRFD